MVTEGRVPHDSLAERADGGWIADAASCRPTALVGDTADSGAKLAGIDDHCRVSEGVFWNANGARVRGRFVAESGLQAEVSLDGATADDPRVTVEHTATGLTVTSLSGNPAKDVAAFASIELLGNLDSGERVSLIGAQNHGFLDKPHYVARVAVIGAHVPGDQLYGAVRFRIDALYWTAHLADGEAYTVPDDGSVLRAVAAEDGLGMWLVYESAEPHSARDLEIRVLGGCRTLARLVLDVAVVLRTVEVRIDQGGDWLHLHSRAFSEPVVGFDQSLLPREELTVERFAKWIALNDSLDGLASAVDGLGAGTVQTQVLIGTSLVEGLHRRLPYKQSQFPAAPGGARGRVKKAARNAAVRRAAMEKGLKELDLVRTALMNAVSHFEDVDYRLRAQNITDVVASAVPELVESVPDLPGKLLAARNELAHHLVLDDEKEPLAVRIDRWVAISYVTPWLLRLLLLLHAGIEADTLHAACLDSQRFGYFRANVAAITDELGWLSNPDLRRFHGKSRANSAPST